MSSSLSQVESEQELESIKEDDGYIKISKYDICRKVHIKLQEFIFDVLACDAIIFGGYIIFEIKKSHFTKLFYDYCMTNNINYKKNFNNPECHPESNLRMSSPFHGKSDIDMYIQEKDLEKLMDYFKNEYDIIEHNPPCSYFIKPSIRSNLGFKKMTLTPKVAKQVSSTLNSLFSSNVRSLLFPRKNIDLIIIKNNANIKAPFNCPDFKCNQFFMYYSKFEQRIITSHNAINIPMRLSYIDEQKFMNDKMEIIKQQCIDNVAELCDDNVPQLHRVLKMLLKDYTINIPPENIPGGTKLGCFKHKIPESEKTDNKCTICYDNFEKDTQILYSCKSCSTPYHIDCYIMFHMENVKNHRAQPDCPNCREKLEEDYCAFVNMVFLINHFKECLKINNMNKMIGIKFQYCNQCKITAPKQKVPDLIKRNIYSMVIKYR